jgi:hypothetical protein
MIFSLPEKIRAGAAHRVPDSPHEVSQPFTERPYDVARRPWLRSPRRFPAELKPLPPQGI